MTPGLPKPTLQGGMRRVRNPVLFLLASASLAHGQIYADFTVSQGGSPLGTFRARLDHDKVPRTCANFIGLATGQRPWIKVTTGEVMENQPYYDGLTFHRLIHNFVIQGGSPNGLGTDSPGYVIQDEYHHDLRHSGRYMLSMAKSNLPCTGGSQFFITLEAAPALNDKHSVFGEVIEGKNIIDGFTNAAAFPTDRSVAGAPANAPGYFDRPVTPLVMNSVVISGPSLAAFDLESPALKLPVISGTSLIPSRNSAASTFTVTFDRGFQAEHLISYSSDLAAWTYYRTIRSRDAATGFSYTLPGVNFSRFFVNSARVDYGALENPPPAFLLSGKQFTLNDRHGNQLIITPNGAGGGTWNHSNGGSGTLTALTTSDGTGSSGQIEGTSVTAHFFPLAGLNATFNTPVGPQAWTSLSLVLSFHSASSGWVEGSAQIPGDPNPVTVGVQQSFTITP